MSFAHLDRRLRFLPLGLIWGVVAVAFHTQSILSPRDGCDQCSWLVPIGTVACTCLIATPLSSAMLKLEISSIRWVINWVATGIASCIGGVVVFYLTVVLWAVLQWLGPFHSSSSDHPPSVAGLMLFWVWISLGPAMQVATGSTIVALLLAPFSLLGRWLIRRRTCAAETAGGASQAKS